MATDENGPAEDPMDALANTTTATTSVPTQVVVEQNSQFPLATLSTITRPGSLINISRILPEELAEIDKLAVTISLDNQTAVTMFSSDVQKQYSDGLSSLLGESTLGQAGLFDFIAADLKLSNDTVREAMEKFSSEEDDIGMVRKVLRGLPFFGGHITTAEVILKAKETLVEIFDRMEQAVAARQRSIIENQTKLDILIANLKTYLLLLRRHILAGEKGVLRMYEEYAALHRQLPENPDPMDVAKLIEKRNLVIGFEVCLILLKNAYVKAGTLLPAQIQTITSAGQIVLQNLRDIVTITIPDMKTSALQLTALNELRQATAQGKVIKDQATIAAEQAQELLGQVMIGAKEQQGEALNEAQRLRGLMEKMVALNAKVAELDQANAKKREEAETLLIESKSAFDEVERATAKRFLELAKPSA